MYMIHHTTTHKKLKNYSKNKILIKKLIEKEEDRENMIIIFSLMMRNIYIQIYLNSTLIQTLSPTLIQINSILLL